MKFRFNLYAGLCAAALAASLTAACDKVETPPVAEAAEWLTQRREQQRAEHEALQARQEALTRRNVGLTRTGREGPGLGL